nr:unnamed protein product [Callosobruchus analis]
MITRKKRPDKTSTTWTQEMVWMIMNNLDVEKAKEDIHSRVPFVELSWNNDYDRKNLSEPFQDSLGFIRKKYGLGPVCMKTHLPWQLLPREIQENLKKPKIIYVIRNCKDAAVSSYHFLVALYQYTGTREELYNMFLSDEVIYTPYWTHVLGFWGQRHKPNVMILRYEEMIKDLPGTMRKVASFLEKPLTDDQISNLKDHLSFDSMKKNSAVNNEELIKIVRKQQGRGEAETGHMRRGEAGSHKDEMSPEMVKRFDEWIEANTRNTDFTVI